MAEVRQRESVITTFEEAAALVKDGSTISIGGFINSSHPMGIIRQIIRNKVKNLTVIGAASSGLEIDLLIAARCVKKVIAPYVGAEGMAAVGPCFRSAAQKGEIQVWEIDEAMYYAGLRAAAQGLPFNPWRSGLGTSYPVVNPDLKIFNDPINGEQLLAIPAIEPEISFLHAGYSDCYGNVRHVGTGWGDRAHFAAADQTIVQVEQMISNEEIRSNPLATSIPGANGVIRAQFSSHPYSSPGFYREDETHIRAYVKAASEYLKTGSRSLLDDYLNFYIYETKNEVEYLEKIGIAKLLFLYEY